MPLIIIVYCNVCIFLVLRRSHQSNTNGEFVTSSNRDVIVANAKRNVIQTLAIVSACLLVCWLGNSIYLLLYTVGYNVNFNSVFYHMTVVAVFMNSFINPLVYAVKYKSFKKRVRNVICFKKRKRTQADISITIYWFIVMYVTQIVDN